MENNIRKENVITRFAAPIVILLGTVLLGWHLQTQQAYMFFYRESQQLIFLEWDYIAELISQFGGLGITLSQLLVQFFVHPMVGAVATAMIAGASAWMFYLTMRKINHSKALVPLTFAPALIQTLYLIDSYHNYEGLMAILALSVTLWCYSLCRKMNYKARLAVGVALAMALYLLFGSIAVLFAVCALALDAMLKSEKWYWGVIYVATLLIAGSYMVSNGAIADYDFAYGPKNYYEFYIEVTPFLTLAWWSVVIMMFCFFASRWMKLGCWSSIAVCVVLCTTMAGLYIQRHDKDKKEDIYTYMMLYHNIVNEQWDEILSNREINYQVPLHRNCVNFALSKRGELLDKLFLYPQGDATSLIKEMGTFVEEHSIYSEIYYHLGIVSQTLELSLAAMAGTYPGTPLLLQQFVRSRIVMGDYDLAEKFVYRLEQTYAYSDWAREQRKFLHNDEAVEKDEEYGLKRRTLPELSSEFVSLYGLMYDLMKVLTANPENNVAREYAIACLLLNKNFNDISYFVERYYNTPILPELPVRLQEAVVTYSEKDMEYCRRYGVSEQTIKRFASFRQKVLTLRRQRPNFSPKPQLAEFRDTFWYYMLK